MPPDVLGRFEELLMIAVLHLRDNAYGVTIRAFAEEKSERDVAIGAIYTTLQRLEDKGFVKSRTGEPTAQRGGRAKRYYKLTASGRATLAAQERATKELWIGPVGELA